MRELLFLMSVLMKKALISDFVFWCYSFNFYSISFSVPRIRPSQGFVGRNTSFQHTICSSIFRITDTLRASRQECRV